MAWDVCDSSSEGKISAATVGYVLFESYVWDVGVRFGLGERDGGDGEVFPDGRRGGVAGKGELEEEVYKEVPVEKDL